MTTENSQVDNSISEFKASLSGSTGEAVLRRINAERLLRIVADELVESHQPERIRVLADSRIAGEPGADFLLQIDDYDVRLELLDTRDGKPALHPDKLPEIARLLQDNPSTVAVLLVWTTDELPTVGLTAARVRYLLQHADQVAQLVRATKPLPEALRQLIAEQTKVWEIGLGSSPRSLAQPADIRRLFEDAIGKAIEQERGRAYRYTERRQAARDFSAEEEKRVIFAALKDALEGASARDLVPRLTRIGRRGAK